MKWKLFFFIVFTCLLSFGLFMRSGRLGSENKKKNYIQMTSNAPFLEFCCEAVANPDVFAQFKRHPIYNIFQENLTFEEGQEALKIVEKKYPEILQESIIERIRRVDYIGRPRVYTYEPYGPLSPNTVLYLKIAGDIKDLLRGTNRASILEIGGGSGGLCKVLHEILDIENYTIVELEKPALLIKKHLYELGLNQVRFITPEQINLDPYDLILSYDGFTESNSVLQKYYMKKLFPNATKGYLVCNFYPRQVSVGSLSKEKLIKDMNTKYENVEVFHEEALMGKTNCIITWRK